MEHDDLPIDELSVIAKDNHNDDTMSAEKENHGMEQRGDKNSRRGYNGESEGQQPSNYKTRLCMMHASGTKPCEMGSRCKFAHGLKELRSTDVVCFHIRRNQNKLVSSQSATLITNTRPSCAKTLLAEELASAHMD